MILGINILLEAKLYKKHNLLIKRKQLTLISYNYKNLLKIQTSFNLLKFSNKQKRFKIIAITFSNFQKLNYSIKFIGKTTE